MSLSFRDLYRIDNVASDLQSKVSQILSDDSADRFSKEDYEDAKFVLYHLRAIINGICENVDIMNCLEMMRDKRG